MSNILLIGNKNVGKTTIYNLITNQSEKVANISGSTVDFKSFAMDNNTLIDLPGVDDFNPTSEDEKVVNDFILNNSYEHINLVINSANIVKSTNLLIEIMELNKRVNIILHQSDQIKESENLKNEFKKHFNTNVYLTSQKDKKLFKEIWTSCDKCINDFKLDYNPIIENLISRLENLVPEIESFNKRFIAIQLLLNNKYFFNILDFDKKLLVNQEIEKVQSSSKYPISRTIHLARKMFVEKIVRDSKHQIVEETELQKNIDNIILNRFLGPIIYVLIVLGIYYTSVEVVGIPLQNLWTDFLDKFSTFLIDHIHILKTNEILNSLVSEVIFGSLGTIIGFVPMILSIYMFTSLLENTGYNYRASVLFDNVFEKFGLDGRSVVSIMTGYGCNVPAILATRTQKSKIKRYISILILPFVPCVARIPMISLFSSLFFKSWHFVFIFLFNVIILVIMLLAALLLKNTKFKKTKQTMILEYPRLKLPNLPYIIKLSWKTSLNYVSKIFTTLLIGALLVWIITNFGLDGFHSTKPFISYILFLFGWIFVPFGIHDPRFGGLLIVGFSVKELLLSTIPVLFHQSVSHVLTSNFNQVQAFCILLFFILYTPCLSTYLTIKKEIGTKLANFSILFSLFIAYSVSYILFIILSLIFK